MPYKLKSTVLAAALALAFNTSSALRADEPAAPAATAPPVAEKQLVTVEVTVVEIALTKLRAIGFDWDAVTKKSAADLPESKKLELAVGNNLDGFVKALVRHNLANVLHRPKLQTLDGRPAYVHVGDETAYLRLDVVPIVLGSGRIRVEHRLELPHRSLKSNSAIEVEPGAAVIASQIRKETKDADGKACEVITIVVVRADSKVDDRVGAAGVPSTTPAAQVQDKEMESRPIKRWCLRR